MDSDKTLAIVFTKQEVDDLEIAMGKRLEKLYSLKNSSGWANGTIARNEALRSKLRDKLTILEDMV